MEVIKELIVRYKDGRECKYTLGDRTGFELKKTGTQLQIHQYGYFHSEHYLEKGVSEYSIRNVVVREGEDTPSPKNEVETFKYVCIILNSGNTVEYKGASVELRENTIEVFREGLSASFFLRDVSGWELREE